jgi:hypothetical protein
MLLKLPLFMDARYNAGQDLQFDSENVASLEETARSLLLGSTHSITNIVLKDGRRTTLAGHVQEPIAAARGFCAPIELK